VNFFQGRDVQLATRRLDVGTDRNRDTDPGFLRNFYSGTGVRISWDRLPWRRYGMV